MTLVVIGPVTRDLVIVAGQSSQKVGGASYFQSFVFERFYGDYLVIVNCDDESLIEDFPDIDKVIQIRKDDTHFFVNEYPDANDLDIRRQVSNFAEIPIYPDELKEILPESIDGFVLNPLNRHDFPTETIDFLKTFDVPIFLSIQGFLRVPDKAVNENHTIRLDKIDDLNDILDGVSSIFLDEREAGIIGQDFDVGEMVITNGSMGSRIVSDMEIKIEPVPCEDVVDTTGCGDTYMAAYITQKLLHKSSENAGNFASMIASEKIANFGPYNSNG